MTDPARDPLDALREPVTPVDPDAGFAAELRARLQRALLHPEGDPAMTTATAALTTPAEELALGSLTPYISVADARAALDFYVDAFGARRRGEPYVMDDGRIGHAELVLGDSVLMLAEEFAEMDMLSPVTRGGPSQSLMLQVSDVDATVARAVERGAELTREVADYPHGRNGVVNDPFGHRWMISAAPVPRVQGGVVYAALWTPDMPRAAAFFTTVLGWSYADSGPYHRSVATARPQQAVVPLSAVPGGIWDDWPRHPTLFLAHAVDDVDAAVARVRAAGGHATAPRDEPYGRIADCVDDQGMPFAIGEGAGPEPAGTPRHGQLAYLTLEVGDTARARAFFAAVFGWRFQPGRVPDGWQIEGITPMGGLHGGHDMPTVVPMYAVDDVHAALARVRAEGGTATEPEQQPYGLMSSCADDQGTRFHLGQLG